MNQLLKKVTPLAAGTIASIARQEAIFSRVDCDNYKNIDRIHLSFSQFVICKPLEGVSTWQDAWHEFIIYSQSKEAAEVMRDLLKRKHYTPVSENTSNSWLSPSFTKYKIDDVNGVLMQALYFEPFVIQQGFFELLLSRKNNT